MAEQDATAIGRKRKAKQRYTAGFFDSHPTELKRATYLSLAAQKIGGGGDAERLSTVRRWPVTCQSFLPRRAN